MRKIKGLSYDTDKDKDVIDHIKKQACEYKYVWDLVRKDMTEDCIETKIRREIEKYFLNKNIITMDRIDTKEEIKSFDNEEVSNIKEILSGI